MHKRSPSPVPELPPADTKFWTIRRKAAIVEAVRSNRISLEEACLRYEMSGEEFHQWQQAVEQHGIGGLKATGPRLKKN
jgi:transposase-like protein